ncbi:hypothetical protein LCGC14_0043650 [marine sediment metagenome]|uniref:Uncharacterized protein n=2 Tax=root TaxID=1 RepID=A0A7V1BIG6_9RHOB|nr:DUF6338 family protein [Sulfitobacter litoralis]HDZ53420.1 hypothetical protein [Sulfitobacter litoralis]
MNGLTSLDAAYLAMSFFVPGYVYFVVRGHLIPGQRSRGLETPIRLLSVSTVNFSIWAWAVYLVLESASLPTWARPAIWTFSILISPVIMGILSGLVFKYRLIDKLYMKIGFNPSHVTPTSWDFAFSQEEERFIIVTLTDGKRFAGLWGGRSFASDLPSERDIFIEKVYKIKDGDTPWEPTNRTVLLRADVIRSVEFIPLT